MTPRERPAPGGAQATPDSVTDGPTSRSTQSESAEWQAGEFFENFTHSVTAARLLLQRAHKSGSFIEGLVLYASSIDGVLRNLLALRLGDRNGTVIQLDPRYFYHDDTKWMNERDVYAEAVKSNVLTEPEFQELKELYRFRNAAIHRFIISGMTYADIAPRLDKYEIILTRLLERLREIEQPDGDPLPNETRAKVHARLARKIGKL
jgi:hypothetical protein